MQSTRSETVADVQEAASDIDVLMRDIELYLEFMDIVYAYQSAAIRDRILEYLYG